MRKTQVLLVIILLLLIGLLVLISYQYFVSRTDHYLLKQIGHCANEKAVSELIDEFFTLGFGKRNLQELKRSLENVEGVQEATVKLALNYGLSITLRNTDPDYLLVCENSYYEVSEGLLKQCDLTANHSRKIEITREYLNNLLTFGLNSEFFQVLSDLEVLLDNKSLKITVKYDNNMSGNLGWLVVDVPSCNSTIFVKEKVSIKRLATVIKLISSRAVADESGQIYDLYANVLVKRG